MTTALTSGAVLSTRPASPPCSDVAGVVRDHGRRRSARRAGGCCRSTVFQLTVVLLAGLLTRGCCCCPSRSSVGRALPAHGPDTCGGVGRVRGQGDGCRPRPCPRPAPRRIRSAGAVRDDLDRLHDGRVAGAVGDDVADVVDAVGDAVLAQAHRRSGAVSAVAAPACRAPDARPSPRRARDVDSMAADEVAVHRARRRPRSSTLSTVTVRPVPEPQEVVGLDVVAPGAVGRVRQWPRPAPRRRRPEDRDRRRRPSRAGAGDAEQLPGQGVRRRPPSATGARAAGARGSRGDAACALAGTSAAATATMATRMERRAMSGNPSDTCCYLHGELPSGRHRTAGTGRIGSACPARPPEDHLFGGAAGWIVHPVNVKAFFPISLP